MSATPEQEVALTVRFLELTEGPTVRELFHAAFNQTMSQALWDWKYAKCESRCVGVFRGDELIAHYGLIDAPISYFGKPAKALQTVDVMVKPSYRRAVKKETSPFFLAGHFSAEHWAGYDRPFLLGYGFPNDRHMQLAQHLGLYEPVGRMFEVVWQVPAQVPGPGFWRRVERIDSGNLEAGRKAIDGLWRQLQVDLIENIVVRKDTDWLRRRYLSHPEKQYALYLLRQRFSGQPLGVVVLKEEDTRVQLMDYIGPLARLPQMVQFAQHQARAAGKDVLYTWCSEVFVPRFTCHDGSAHPLQITTPATTRMPGPTAAELRDRWWLLPGDTDFL